MSDTNVQSVPAKDDVLLSEQKKYKGHGIFYLLKACSQNEKLCSIAWNTTRKWRRILRIKDVKDAIISQDKEIKHEQNVSCDLQGNQQLTLQSAKSKIQLRRFRNVSVVRNVRPNPCKT